MKIKTDRTGGLNLPQKSTFLLFVFLFPVFIHRLFFWFLPPPPTGKAAWEQWEWVPDLAARLTSAATTLECNRTPAPGLQDQVGVSREWSWGLATCDARQQLQPFRETMEGSSGCQQHPAACGFSSWQLSSPLSHLKLSESTNSTATGVTNMIAAAVAETPIQPPGASVAAGVYSHGWHCCPGNNPTGHNCSSSCNS